MSERQLLTEKQFSRNPVISRVLAKVKYIEDLGEEWNKIIYEHKNHQLKPRMPKVKADEYSVLVIIYSAKDKFDIGKLGLNERQINVLGLMVNEKHKMTIKNYSGMFSISKKTAKRDMGKLMMLNLIIKRGVKKGAYFEAK